MGPFCARPSCPATRADDDETRCRTLLPLSFALMMGTGRVVLLCAGLGPRSGPVNVYVDGLVFWPHQRPGMGDDRGVPVYSSFFFVIRLRLLFLPSSPRPNHPVRKQGESPTCLIATAPPSRFQLSTRQQQGEMLQHDDCECECDCDWFILYITWPSTSMIYSSSTFWISTKGVSVSPSPAT